MAHSDRDPSPSSSAPPRVALLVETQVGPGRDILRGVARYVRESGPWSLHLDPRTQQFTEGWTPAWLANWRGNGLIGRFATQSVVAAAKATHVPVVDVLGVAGRHFPLVDVDDAAIARLAAGHLLDRGFRQFGFIARPGHGWSERRQAAFTRLVEAEGCPCSVLGIGQFEDIPESWDAFIDQAAEWIRNQPKPLGLMVCYDLLGPPATQACRRAGVTVPEEVAIVGVDNDEPVCVICDPPLTSVDPGHEEVGYQAAALLDRLMAGQPAPDAPLYVRPRGVVVRQSSDIAAIEDPAVSQALSIIRQRACNGLQVADVAAQVPVSRSVLQRRFRAVLGRSIHDEILRMQLRKAEELLRETDLPLRTVAEKAGFKHQEYMGAVFKAHLGQTPGQYRRQHQPVTSTFDPGEGRP